MLKLPGGWNFVQQHDSDAQGPKEGVRGRLEAEHAITVHGRSVMPFVTRQAPSLLKAYRTVLQAYG